MLDFLVLALATWRLAHLLVHEDGPLHALARLRALVGIQEVTTLTAQGMQTAYTAANPVAEGLLCLWCTSVWCAAFFLIGAGLPLVGPVVTFVARLLALSAVAIGVHEVIAYLRRG